MKCLLIGVLISVFFTGKSFAQTSPDEVRIQQVEKKQKKDRDTLQLAAFVFMADSLIRDSLRYEYTKIKEFAEKRKWTKQLYKMIFVHSRRSNIDVLEAENSEARFREYSGKTIRFIEVKVLPPFGTSILDTCYARDSMDWFMSLANNLHQRSSVKLIRKQLTIRSGMEVSPFVIVENELLLKDLPNIDDALIEIQEINGDTTRVDLLVVCKDEFCWTGDFSSNFISSVTVGIENRNLFRAGHLARYEIRYRDKKEQKWGNVVEYRMPNLFSSRFDFQGYYENTNENDLFTFQIEKRFLTSQTKWAGGALFSRVYSSTTLVDRDIVKPIALFNYRLVDLWAGKSFKLPVRYSFNQNIYMAARYWGTRFMARPEVSSDSNHFYYNRDRYMGALTYVKIKYFKANLIYDFGRTEDIPSGLYGTLLFGFEKNEFDKFAYLGTSWCYSWFDIHSDRFFSLFASLGSFFNGTRMESGVLRLSGNYISRLYELSRHRMRLYGSVDYIKGLKRNPEDYIYFQNFNIHGFDSDTLRGTHRLSGSASATLFLPKINYGFRTAISGYLDAGVLGSNHKSIFKSKTWWGIGVGINLRNDNIVFKNFNIRLTYYPRVPADFHMFDVSASGKRKTGFFDYKVHKPETVKYE